MAILAKQITRIASRAPLAASVLAMAVVACGPQAPSDPARTAAALSGPIDRCVNLTDTLGLDEDLAWSDAVTRSDLMSISSAGFDTVRLPLPLMAFTGDTAPYQLKPAALERLDQVVDWASAANLGVVLTVSDVADHDTDPLVQTGQLNQVWTQLAIHFRDQSDALYFELVDAPTGDLTGSRLSDLNDVTLGSIRAADTRRWVIVPVADSSLEALTTATATGDARTMRAVRYFEPVSVTQPAPLDHASEQVDWGSMADFRSVMADMQTISEARARLGEPVLISGFGVHADVPAVMRARWTRAVRQTAEDNQIGWCHWTYSGDHGLFDVETGRWVPELIDALFRDGDTLN